MVKELSIQILIIIFLTVLLSVIKRFLHKLWPNRLRPFDFWPFILAIFIFQNCGLQVFAYILFIWAMIATVLIIYQWVRYHEFIYRRFVPLFWRLTLVYTTLFYVFSIFIKIMG